MMVNNSDYIWGLNPGVNPTYEIGTPTEIVLTNNSRSFPVLVSSIYVPNFSPIGPVEKNLSLDQGKKKKKKKHGTVTVVTTIVAPPEVGVTKRQFWKITNRTGNSNNIIKQWSRNIQLLLTRLCIIGQFKRF